MASRNDVTGDALVSKVTTDKFRDNWALAFGNKNKKEEKHMLVHKHIILRIEANNPPSEEGLRDWMVDLVDKIGMKLLAGPISANVDVEGNQGPTCVLIIETSHMACHIWTEPDPALIQLDVYTCGPFDPQTVLDHIQEWDPVNVSYKYLDREHDLTDISHEVDDNG